MYCPSCGTKLSDTANFCGKCSHHVGAPAPALQPTVPTVPRKQPAVRLKNVLILLGIFFVVGFGLVILGVIVGPQDRTTTGTSSSPSNPVPSTSNPRGCLSVSGDNGRVDEMSTTITGTVQNNCGKNFRYVQVTFKLFDTSGDVVGTAIANQAGLSAGETWRFKAHGFTRSHTFRVDDITAF
jgi:zinc-ribbon domain